MPKRSFCPTPSMGVHTHGEHADLRSLILTREGSFHTCRKKNSMMISSGRLGLTLGQWGQGERLCPARHHSGQILLSRGEIEGSSVSVGKVNEPFSSEEELVARIVVLDDGHEVNVHHEIFVGRVLPHRDADVCKGREEIVVSTPGRRINRPSRKRKGRASRSQP